jgi:hypothetical protein
MFSESMLSMPASNVEELEPTSYLPAFLAFACAWLIALLRGVLGVVGHEGLDLDMALTVLVLVVGPLFVFSRWRTGIRHRTTRGSGELTRWSPRRSPSRSGPRAGNSFSARTRLPMT